MRKKISFIWAIPDIEFKKIISTSDTVTEILKRIGSVGNCGNRITLKQRIKADGLDVSHLPIGNHRFNGGRKFKVEKIPLEKILVEHSTYARGNLKKRLIDNSILKNVCANVKCGQLPIWNDEPLVLILDHINGVPDDHRLENLQLLCPNCNSQTKTFGGRNQSKHEKRRCVCGNILSRTTLGVKCVSCYRMPQNKS